MPDGGSVAGLLEYLAQDRERVQLLEQKNREHAQLMEEKDESVKQTGSLSLLEQTAYLGRTCCCFSGSK